MENFEVNGLYSKIRKEVKEKPYKILSGTKTLALSSSRYHKFYKSSINLFQKNSFKLPDENIYPKLKKSSYISLKKKISTFELNSRNNSQKKSPKSRPYSAESSIKNSLYEKYKKKKTPNFFIAENISKGKYYLSSKRYNNNSKSQNNISDYYKDIYQLFSIKNSEKRVKDFFMLLNSIFYDDDYYNDIKYNEKEIFGHKEENLNYLKEELNNFIKKEKEINVKSDLLQIFMTKKYGKIELTLKSARIDLIDDDNNNEDVDNDNILSINIPFDLMCLIYMCSGKQINYLILILLKIFKSQNLKESEENIIIFSEEQRKEIFFEILSLFSLENKNVKLNITKKNYERYYSQLKYLEKIKEITDFLKYNNFVNNFYNKNNKIKIIDNTNNNIYTTPNYKSSMKINFDTNLNKYTLYLVSERKKYKAQFYMPEIVLTFNHYMKQINHYIDKELFIYLYQNNFMYWDYYILHYLFSYKSFRHFMGGILSIKKKNKINYFLSNIKKIRKKAINNSKINDNNSFLNTKIYKYYLNDLYFYQMNYNENCFEFKFLMSNNNNLYSYKLKSYSLYAFLSNINKPAIYEFNFNFHQMKILYYISLYECLNSFLKKIIYIKDDIIYVDYSYFDSFSNLSNKDLIKYFDDVNNINIDYKIKDYTKDQNQINSLILIVYDPFIQVDDLNINLENKNCNKIIQSTIKLKSKFFEDLINTNINEWIKVIFEHKEELDDKNHTKYEDNKKKILKKQKTINKNKEIHKSAYKIKIH